MHEAMWFSEASLGVVLILTAQRRNPQHREDKGLAPRSALGLAKVGLHQPSLRPAPGSVPPEHSNASRKLTF